MDFNSNYGTILGENSCSVKKAAISKSPIETNSIITPETTVIGTPTLNQTPRFTTEQQHKSILTVKKDYNSNSTRNPNFSISHYNYLNRQL